MSNVFDEYVRLKEENQRLREALAHLLAVYVDTTGRDNTPATEKARAALAGAQGETRTLPVDDEAEARFEKLLTAKHTATEVALRQAQDDALRHSRRALAERVREAASVQCSTKCNEGCEARIEAIDLAALLEEDE